MKNHISKFGSYLRESDNQEASFSVKLGVDVLLVTTLYHHMQLENIQVLDKGWNRRLECNEISDIAVLSRMLVRNRT